MWPALDALIDPRAEWAQIFRETWRIQREYFYDASMHGANWQAVYDKYRPLVPFVAHRADLSYLIAMVGGELAVGHSYITGPAINPTAIRCRSACSAPTTRSRTGATAFARSTPARTGIRSCRRRSAHLACRSAEGDYLLEVNGRALAPPTSVYQMFAGHRRTPDAAAREQHAVARGLARHHGGAGRERRRVAHARVDREQPAARRQAVGRTARVRLAAQHRHAGLHRVQPPVTTRSRTKKAR